MHFITDFSRAYQERQPLFEAPFTPKQVVIFEVGKQAEWASIARGGEDGSKDSTQLPDQNIQFWPEMYIYVLRLQPSR
jgi:hypothetical protein